MKVLLIAPYFFERHRWMISAYKTALALAKRMDVVVLTAGKPAEEQFGPSLRIYRSPDWFLPDPVNYSIVPGLIPALERVIRKEKPDVFLINKHMFFTSFAVWWLRLRGKKVILATDTFPGMNWHPRHPLVKVVMTIYAYLLGWPILRAANKVILFHEGLIPVAKRLGLKYRVIHNGVDQELIDDAIPAADIRAEGIINVAYIGRMETIKGYDDLLAVAQDVAPRYPHVRFLFVGSHHGKDDFVAKVSSPQIKFTGHRDDIPAILKAIDIFVLPSYSEGLPNALMEAMAAGRACVASAVGGVKTLIQDGQNGLLFTAGDRHQLAQKIELLINDKDLCTRLGAAAQKTIRSSYDWATIADQYESLFKEYSPATV